MTKLQCSSRNVCGNKGCMTYKPHDEDPAIDGLMICPIVGREVKRIEVKEENNK